MLEWHLIPGDLPAQMAEGSLHELVIGNRKVGLLKKGGRIYAFAATCPHASGRLCDGWLDARGHIVCPEHKYRFDPANGRNSSGEGYKLRTYQVEQREDGCYIGLMTTQ